MATIKYKENGEWVELSIGGSGGSITLDSEMSDTSTNAVSNKVIKEYVDNAVSNSGGGTGGGSIAVDDALSLESTNPVQNKVVSQYVGIRFLDANVTTENGWDKVVQLYESLSSIGAAPIIKCKMIIGTAIVLDVVIADAVKYVLLYSEGRTFYIARDQSIKTLPVTIDLDRGIDGSSWSWFLRLFFVLGMTSESGNMWAKKGNSIFPITRFTLADTSTFEVCMGNFLHTYQITEINADNIIPVTLISSKYIGVEISASVLSSSEDDPYSLSDEERERFIEMFAGNATQIVLEGDSAYYYPSVIGAEYLESDGIWVITANFAIIDKAVVIGYFVETREVLAYCIN